ncbi:GNAT family N-acetyltransferase [Planococcus sp. CPCC 101016]|uniref:GNAT family N-acetyltransferase n=1 Tax=Planococcus sp. CPCC 101016 TaxID=2599617 RepID=UPI0011B4A2EA|nr:GNAT family N-acetyltransferase [Planococcus sp. CPCC 101016]TWT07720.1 GNAT family N-acetyltransferase [Planococcus sp. CPCC 101016]
MQIDGKEFEKNHLAYTIRSAVEKDAGSLSKLRVQVDGETENLDREKGEAYIDDAGFSKIIREDSKAFNSLFLVAEADGQLAGFSRCAGSQLKRTCHQTEFGIAVLKKYWGYGIGQHLLMESIRWADENQLKKLTLRVLETNIKAIKLYEKHGFEVEGILKKDKLLSDGNYYDTVLLGRINRK